MSTYWLDKDSNVTRAVKKYDDTTVLYIPYPYTKTNYLDKQRRKFEIKYIDSTCTAM